MVIIWGIGFGRSCIWGWSSECMRNSVLFSTLSVQLKNRELPTNISCPDVTFRLITKFEKQCWKPWTNHEKTNPYTSCTSWNYLLIQDASSKQRFVVYGDSLPKIVTILVVTVIAWGVDPMYIDPMLGKPKNHLFSPQKVLTPHLLLIGFEFQVKLPLTKLIVAHVCHEWQVMWMNYVIPLATNTKDTSLGCCFFCWMIPAVTRVEHYRFRVLLGVFFFSLRRTTWCLCGKSWGWLGRGVHVYPYPSSRGKGTLRVS